MIIQKNIAVKYQYTTDANQAKIWLEELPDLFAADFETAIKYTAEEVKEAKERMDDESYSYKDRIRYKSIANADPFVHPSHCTITHCSIAYSEKDAYVIVFTNKEVAMTTLNFLVNTDKTQIWHNYCYDGKFIRYFTYKDVKNLEDSQVLAKTLKNHVKNDKSLTSLKVLAGGWYGEWSISADHFTKAERMKENIIKYAATDACATYKLWHYMKEKLAKLDSKKP